MSVTKYTADGRTWYRVAAWVHEGGRRRLKRQGRIPTREQAEKLAKSWAADSIDGKWFDRAADLRMTVAEVWDIYSASSARLDSHASDCSRAAHLVRHLGAQPAASLSRADVDAYRAKRLGETTRRGGPPSPATLDREVELLVRALGYATECRKLRANPLEGTPLLRRPNVRKSVLSETTFQAGLRRVADDPRSAWQVPVLLVAFDTGMRIGEVLGLRRDRIDWQTGRLELVEDETKTEEPRIVYLSARALAALRELPAHVKSPLLFWTAEKGGKVKQRSPPRRGFKSAFGADVWVHDLRRSFITNARKKGVAESVVMKMSGHKTASVFRRYNIVDEQDVRDAQAQLEAGRGERLDPSTKKA